MSRMPYSENVGVSRIPPLFKVPEIEIEMFGD